MPNTFFGLSISTSGLYTASAGLNTTAHNISNARTEGYSRQIIYSKANDALRVYQEYGTIGSGVNAYQIKQVRDEYYDVKYRQTSEKLSENSTKRYYMYQIENFFNEMEVDGFTEEYDSMFNALQDLKDHAEDMNYRDAAVNKFVSMLDYFASISTNLTRTQNEANLEVSNQVDRVNVIARSVATLNKQINSIEINGGYANDLRDQRALLLDELSEIVPIETTEIPKGNGGNDFRVTINGQALVSEYDYFTLQIVTREESNNSVDLPGLYDIEWSFGDPFHPQALTGGSLKALFDIRDGNGNKTENYVYMDDSGTQQTGTREAVDYKGIPYYINKINGFVDTICKEFNKIQAKGQDLYGNAGADTPIFVTSDGSDTFQAKTAQVNKAMSEDPGLLVTATVIKEGVAGDDLVDEMLEIKEAKLFLNGSSKYYLQSIVGEISIDCRRASTLEENYNTIRGTIENQRLSESGVDEDEEAMNIMKYQEMYELSSKMISTMQAIYDKLINETGV